MRKVGLFTALTGMTAGVLVVLLLRPWQPHSAGPDLETIAYPPDALADYMPPDAAGVLNFDLRRLREAPLTQGPLGPLLRRLVARTRAELSWLGLAGIDAWNDIDRFRVVLPAGDAGRPLWLVHGRIDPDRFQVGPKQLTPRVEGDKRVYQFTDPAVGPTLLAQAGDTLVVSAVPARLTAALADAAEPHAAVVQDPTVREPLEKVDHSRPVWLAVSLRALGDTGRMENRLLEALTGPVLRRSRTVEGGLAVGDDLRADMTFRAADEAAAAQLEKVLRDVVIIAEGAPLLPGADPDLLPLLTLLSTATVSRDGRAVQLHSRLTAEQLGP
jgi:hypothetical protein